MIGGRSKLIRSRVAAGAVFVVLCVLSKSAAAQCALNQNSPSVTLCTPANSSTVSSPLNVVAGTTDASRPVTAMILYVDYVAVYKVRANQLNTSVQLGAGRHNITVNAWDSGGAVFKATSIVQVSDTTGGSGSGSGGSSGGGSSGSGASCAATGPSPSVTICSPAAGATVSSPINFQASASSSSPVTKFLVYSDSQLVYQAANSAAVNTTLNLAAGKHNLTAQFFNGAWVKNSEIVTVGTSSGSGSGGSGSGTPSGSVPSLGPIVVVALENHPYSSVVGNAAMPYLNSLMKSGTLAGNFYAAAPGSVPDYFMLTTGNQVSCCTSYAGPYTGNNLARVLIGGGKTWKAYVQGIPKAGYVGTGYYPYVKYHNPFAYFSDVLNSSTQLGRIVPLSQLSADSASGQLPDFSLIVPDNRHNSHDCPNGVSNCQDADKLHAADLFLQNYVPALMTNPAFQQSGLLVIWWDEGSGSNEKTAITLVGPRVKKGYVSQTSYKDQNLLRTIIEGLGLSSFPGASSGTSSMTDIFAP